MGQKVRQFYTSAHQHLRIKIHPDGPDQNGTFYIPNTGFLNVNIGEYQAKLIFLRIQE